MFQLKVLLIALFVLCVSSAAESNEAKLCSLYPSISRFELLHKKELLTQKISERNKLIQDAQNASVDWLQSKTLASKTSALNFLAKAEASSLDMLLALNDLTLAEQAFRDCI